jgi:hypothetical protein
VNPGSLAFMTGQIIIMVRLVDLKVVRTDPKESSMGLVISDEILHAIHMDEGELVQEIAVLLYQKDKLTLGQASKLARMGQLHQSPDSSSL